MTPLTPCHERKLMQEIMSGTISIQNDGSIWRIAKWSNDGQKRKIAIMPRRIDNNITKDGYRRVSFTNGGGKQYICFAHRAVYLYFNGSIDGSLQINHKNAVRSDNHPSNLELVTQGENFKHAFRVTRTKSQLGSKNNASRLSESDVARIRKMKELHPALTAAKIAEHFSVGEAGVLFILRRKTWRHVP